ncbi:MAG: ATP-binding protein [Marinilabiliaceae bacterium]|nr:ATP-binding protein [Marinilabiliaceae bacterium]
MTERKYPIGVQDFKCLIEDGWLYADKTDFVYKLAHSHKSAFLSRPRRFGKSLLCSTLCYYFEGERELFKGLKIDSLEKDWVKHPVLHFGFSTGSYTDVQSFNNTLSAALAYYEKEYGKEEHEVELSDRFAGILRRAHEQTGQKAVVLIDEYDKPLLESLSDKSLNEQFRVILKSFYGTMKFSDPHIRFIFLTGVTKFSKVSIFSDLNNLDDITMMDEYAGICGITSDELKGIFTEEVAAMAEKSGVSWDVLFDRLREMYDGYHFSPCMLDVYNPFSLLSSVSKKMFGYYWFSTATPTILTRLLKSADYDLRGISGVKANASRLGDISDPELDPIPILFQSGYLTIKDYDSRFDNYTLDFPNREVRSGFFDYLLPTYVPASRSSNSFNISSFVEDVEAGRVDDFMNRIKSLLANIPYTQADDERRQRLIEQQYQNVVYILFTLMGFYTKVEYHTALGRIDLSVETPDYIYVMEFKVGQGSAEDALKQIDDSHYADTFLASGKQLMKVGVGFDNATRNIDKWVVVRG